jgi:hypothetical protein
MEISEVRLSKFVVIAQASDAEFEVVEFEGNMFVSLALSVCGSRNVKTLARGGGGVSKR